MQTLILNFHGVGPLTRSTDEGERNCWLDQDHFEAVLDAVMDCRKVRYTIDDGNASDFDIVLPALLRRGLKATFFVCSGRLDQPSFLSRVQVSQLIACGMGIGSHGVAHLPWRHLPPALLKEELEGSRRALQEVCGVPVDLAACPFGSYDRTVIRCLRQCGYRSVFTSDGGTADPGSWLQARTTVIRGMTPDAVRLLAQHGPGFSSQLSITVRKAVKRIR